MAYRDRMLPYPLPKDITREEFNRLLVALCRVLVDAGIDPTDHLKTVADLQGTPRLYISEPARKHVDRCLA